MFFHLRVGDLLQVQRKCLASLIGIVEATVKKFFYRFVINDAICKMSCLDGLTTQSYWKKKRTYCSIMKASPRLISDAERDSRLEVTRRGTP